MSIRGRTLISWLVGVAVLTSAAVCSIGVEAKPCTPSHPCPSPTPTPPAAGDPVVTAAGDIADPNPTAATKATAQLVSSIAPNVALTLGDSQYPGGALAGLQGRLRHHVGRVRGKTRPAIGNHDYESSSSAAGVLQLLRRWAPDNWYSYWVGSWHMIVARLELRPSAAHLGPGGVRSSSESG